MLNIGSDIETSIKELAEIIIETTGSKSKIVNLPPLEEGDMTRRLPDNARMKSVLKRDLTPMSEGIKHVVTYLTKQS